MSVEDFGKMCFVQSPLIYHAFNCLLQEVLSSNIIEGLSKMFNNSHDSLICRMTDRNQIHALLTSLIVSNFA